MAESENILGPYDDRAMRSTLLGRDGQRRSRRAGFPAKIAAPLADRENGLVTCLYRGVAEGGFWSKLEALGMSVELMSNVLIANMLEGMKFALGPATATRKDHIARIGGLESTSRYYADDFALGSSIAASGLTVILSSTVVEHVVPRSSFRKAVDAPDPLDEEQSFLAAERALGRRPHFCHAICIAGFRGELALRCSRVGLGVARVGGL